MHQLETRIQAIPPSIFTAGLNAAQHPMSESAMSSPLSTFASVNHTIPYGVPPPSLHSYPLTNPSIHFTTQPTRNGSRISTGESKHGCSCCHVFPVFVSARQPWIRMSSGGACTHVPFHIVSLFRSRGHPMARRDIGSSLLDLLLKNHTPIRSDTEKASLVLTWANRPPNGSNVTWFPNRTPRQPNVKGDTLWRLITSLSSQTYWTSNSSISIF